MPANSSKPGSGSPRLTLPASEAVPAGGTIAVTGASNTDTAGAGTPDAKGDRRPALHEPARETVPAGATRAVSGSYSDRLAAANPGAMFLGITDNNGTLRATDASGVAVTGSGTDSITLNTDYADVEALLKSLTYTASAGVGSDTISFDIWNQAGVETIGSVPVTITPGASRGGLTETWTGAVSSDWNTAGNWSGDAVPTSGDTVLIVGNATNQPTLSDATLTGETITLEGSGNGSPVVYLNDVTLDSALQSGNAGAVQIGGTLTVGAQGTLETDGNATLTLNGTAETIVNYGLISSAPGGTLLIDNGQSNSATSTSLINFGSIVADGGHITLDSSSLIGGSAPEWTLVNTGSIGITNDGVLTLNGTFQGGDIAFDGTGGLALEQGMAFTGGATVSGFGSGDQIDLLGAAGKGGQIAVADGTLDVMSNGTLVQAIPLTGTYGLGNFEVCTTGGAGNATQIVYAAGGQPSGIVDPDITAPASATVAQGATLALSGVTIENAGTAGADAVITAGTGTLYLNGASGSGTHEIGLGPGSTAELNAELAGITYVPAAGATADTISVSASPPAPVETERSIPVTITGGGPALNEPAGESVAPGGTVAVSGSYSDSFAADNPGSLFLGISDSAGTLSATNTAGQTVAGSGTGSIALQTDYVDVNAILASLHYTAASTGGGDTIAFDVWNQAGVESTATTAVTVDPSDFNSAADQASIGMVAYFATNGSGATAVVVPADTRSGAAGSVLLSDVVTHPIGLPLTGGD